MKIIIVLILFGFSFNGFSQNCVYEGLDKDLAQLEILKAERQPILDIFNTENRPSDEQIVLLTGLNFEISAIQSRLNGEELLLDLSNVTKELFSEFLANYFSFVSELHKNNIILGEIDLVTSSKRFLMVVRCANEKSINDILSKSFSKDVLEKILVEPLHFFSKP